MEHYNIYEENERGSYTPGFFQMKLSFSFNINDLSSLSQEDLGTFVHEYIHFLQNTSTPFGLWQAMIYYQSISDFFSYIQQHLPISKPIQGYVPSETIQRRINLEKEASGSKEFFKINEKEPLIYCRSLQDINGTKIERISISFKDVDGQNQKIVLGANIIKESMAAMVQELIDPASNDKHDAIPYQVVSRLATQYAPNIAKDNKKLITLCFISLHTLNPGITLINYMSYANENPDKDIITLFEYFLENSSVRKKNDQKMTVEQLGDDIARTFINVLERFIYGNKSTNKLNYLAEVINRVKISSGMIPLLRLLTENDINVKLIKKTVELCGTPVIWNVFGDLSIPNTVNEETSKKYPDFEVMALITSQAMYKFLANPKIVICPLIQFCQSVISTESKDECYDVPWQGKECLISPIANFIGLN